MFVTEGIIDAILLEQLGECAVALCGSQNTHKLLSRCDVGRDWRVVVCGDPDDAGCKMNAELNDGLKKKGIPCDTLRLQTTDGDIASLYQRDRQRLLQLMAQTFLHSEEDEAYAATSAENILDEFFEVYRRGAGKDALSTGFPSLDTVLDGGFFPGLYILGAISSLGKTSFVLQLADYIAATARDVLFFSLEQSRFELVAKSVSRTSARLAADDLSRAFSARFLLRGQEPENPERQALLQSCRSSYRRSAMHLFVQEGLADIGVEEIRAAVQQHVDRRGIAPMVVVDYLQIMKPGDPHWTDKQATDRAVTGLKRLSRDFHIPVLAISSFNRENYRYSVRMEAFKESGAVEYSSDVLLGLQLQGAGHEAFDINAEKSRDPRRIELVILKNRNGIPYAKIPFTYYARYNLFEEL